MARRWGASAARRHGSGGNGSSRSGIAEHGSKERRRLRRRAAVQRRGQGVVAIELEVEQADLTRPMRLTQKGTLAPRHWG